MCLDNDGVCLFSSIFFFSLLLLLFTNNWAWFWHVLSTPILYWYTAYGRRSRLCLFLYIFLLLRSCWYYFRYSFGLTDFEMTIGFWTHNTHKNKLRTFGYDLANLRTSMLLSILLCIILIVIATFSTFQIKKSANNMYCRHFFSVWKIHYSHIFLYTCLCWVLLFLFLFFMFQKFWSKCDKHWQYQ